MIVTEHYGTMEDGVVLTRTYSDRGMRVERKGIRYDESIDPAGYGRVHTETDQLIGNEEI